MTDDLKRDAPRDTGELARKTGVEVTSATQQRITATALVDVPYAEPAVYGHRMFTMPRKSTGVYAFSTKGRSITLQSGRTVSGQVFTRGPITIPATQGNDFFDRVTSQWREYLQRTI